MLQRFYDLQKNAKFLSNKNHYSHYKHNVKIFKITLIYFYFGMQSGIWDLYFI